MRLPPQATPDRLLQSAPADRGSTAPAGAPPPPPPVRAAPICPFAWVVRPRESVLCLRPWARRSRSPRGWAKARAVAPAGTSCGRVYPRKRLPAGAGRRPRVWTGPAPGKCASHLRTRCSTGAWTARARAQTPGSRSPPLVIIASGEDNRGQGICCSRAACSNNVCGNLQLLNLRAQVRCLH